MQAPLVTFLSPCYNHSKYVIESLESIRNQSYPNIQHIIIDDFSTDDSVEKIEQWIKEKNYKCEFIKHKVNKGISYTLNESIRLAKGEYWTPLATDDFIVPERTQEFVDFLIDNPKTNMVTSDCGFVDEHSNNIEVNGTGSFLEYYTKHRDDFSIKESFGTYKSLLKGNYIPSSMMLRTKTFEDVGFFDTKLKMEDLEMWLRVSDKTKIEYINKQLTFYRFHQNNTNTQSQEMLKDFLITFLKQKNVCRGNGLYEEYKRQYERYFYSGDFAGDNKYIFLFNNGSKTLLLRNMLIEFKHKFLRALRRKFH